MRTIALSVVILLLSCAATEPKTAKEQTYSVEPVKLRASVEQLSTEAMMGNGEAAAELTDYFMYEKNEDPKWKEWALIGAEDGYARMQLVEYSSLSESPDPLVQRRAFYWLKKSADAGNASAIAIMKSCYPSGSFESHNPKCAPVETQ